MSEEFISSSRYNLYVNVNTASAYSSLSATDNSHAIQADVDMLLKSSEVIRNLTESQPILVKPSESGAKQLTSQARLTLLLGQLTQVASDVSETQLINNLTILTVKYSTQKNSYTALSDTLQVAIDDLDAAVERLSTASDKLAEATKQHEDAEKLLQELTDKLSQLSPDNREYQGILLQQQQAGVNEKKTAVLQALAEDTYTSALLTCNTAIDHVNKVFDSVNEAEKTYPSNIIASPEKKTDTIGRFIELIASFLQMIGESNVESIKLQSKLMKEVNETRLYELQKSSDEIEAKQRVANKLRSCLSIFAAIVGAVLAVVSVVAAIPSGGMSLAGGVALGFALTSAAFVATDIVLKFTIDISPMNKMFDGISKVISYVVEYTLSYLVEGLAKVSGASESDVKKAKEYCTLITSAILTTVILILPSMAVGAGVSQATSKAASAASQAVQTSVNAAADAAARTVTQVAQTAVNSASKAATVMSSISRSAAIIQIIAAALNTVVSPTLSIIAGVNEKAASEALAKLGMNEGDIKLLSSIRKELAEQSQSVSDTTLELNQAMCEVLNQRIQSMQAGYNNIVRRPI
uniref:type III secretion system translocon subunit SctE n=1 Tax=Yersinia frederiksenii TaxID=29484 RepID=UPI001F4C20DA|nr:type III secretion system translocon subunit SctE [Yersinia frederiksenii]ULG19775.1 type III cell invasion protein SipB [Yersinia frederiksenii]